MTQLYIWPLSAVLKALANKMKKEPTTPSTSVTHFWKQNKIEEQPGWLQHLFATASGTTPSESAQARKTGDGKTLDVGETNAGPADVAEAAFLYCCL